MISPNILFLLLVLLFRLLVLDMTLSLALSDTAIGTLLGRYSLP